MGVMTMRPIRYNTVVRYTDLYEVRKEKSYNIFAIDDEDAEKITLELFLIDEGLSSDMDVTVQSILAEPEVDAKITKVLVSVLRELNKIIIGVTYPEFLRIYENFSGKYLVLGQEPSYYIQFMGFTLQVKLVDHKAVLSRDEIVYTDDEGREYIIKGGNTYVAF